MQEEQLQKLLDKNYMPIIYRNIKKFRKESGIPLIQVAEKLNVSYDYLRRVESENDLVKTCSLKLLIKFSILFNRPLDDFFKGIVLIYKLKLAGLSFFILFYLNHVKYSSLTITISIYHKQNKDTRIILYFFHFSL